MIVLRDVHCRLGRGQPAVMQGLELRVEAGRATFLSGANGAGKSTLLRMVAGVLAPDAGEVRVAGLDPLADRRAVQRGLGWLPPGDRGLFGRLTVRQHLRFWAPMVLVPARDRRAAVDRTLEELDLGTLADRRADRLSTGQRQRLRLGMAIVHDPMVLLLDEPEASLDGPGVAAVQRAVDAVRARGGAALCTGPAGAASALGVDDARVLDRGRIVP